MDEESRIKAFEAEFNDTKKELQKMLLDIRTFLMEAQSPIPNDMEKGKLREELESERG